MLMVECLGMQGHDSSMEPRPFRSSARLHVQRRLVWACFPRSKTLARIGMALLSAIVWVTCLQVGLSVLPAITLAVVNLAGMEKAMRIVGDPRWMVSYTGAWLTGILLVFAAGVVSPLLGGLIGCVAVVTAVRLVVAGMPLAR